MIHNPSLNMKSYITFSAHGFDIFLTNPTSKLYFSHNYIVVYPVISYTFWSLQWEELYWTLRRLQKNCYNVLQEIKLCDLFMDLAITKPSIYNGYIPNKPK